MNPIVNVGIKAVRRAGNLILRYIDRLNQLSVDKKGYNDFVSEVDHMAEYDIIETIHYLYPDHIISVKKSGCAQYPQPDSKNKNEVEWIIDPLDSTINYLHGHPHFCISIAARIKGRIEHGVIFDPLRDEIYIASQGQGAQLNNRRIRVSGQGSLDQSIISTGYSTQDMILYNAWMNSFRSVLLRANTIRYSGSAALDLAYVACGRVDGYWEPGLTIWDIAAGSLLVREAGGLAADFQGQQNFLQSGNIIAANPRIFNDLLVLVKGKAGHIE